MNRPTVSIGIPVYNGERYLTQAVESVLAQGFADLEIVIADNASTDRTGAIARDFARSDRRITYFRFGENVGPGRNFTKAFELSRGKYFNWLAHDDVLAPGYIAACVRVLEQDPSVVLCHAGTLFIDDRGSVIGRFTEDLDTDLPRAHERFRVQLFNWKCFELFGMIRRSALEQMPPPVFGLYGNSDGVLLARLSLLGRFRRIPEELFLNREHPQRGGKQYTTYRELTVRVDPTKRGMILFPRWKMGVEYLRSVSLVPLEASDRAHCYAHFLGWCRQMVPSLAANLLLAGAEIPGYLLRKRPLRPGIQT